jgi:DNA topoisomerase-1
VAAELDRDELALYELIWMRTIASQMKDARGKTVSVRIGATSTAGEDAEFGAAGTVIEFRGFLAAYEEGRDDDQAATDEARLPQLEEGQPLDLARLEAQGHETTPPPRFTEATLVQALEERGIGRPSTYAAIISTIIDRGYVFKRGTALIPTFTAFAVTQLLEQHYGSLVDYEFTARMEDDLDRIAAGEEERVAWLTRFYNGDGGDPGLHQLVTEHLDEIDARAVNSIEIPGSDIVVRVGRYGPYLERGDQRASLPDELAPDELTPGRAEELLTQSSNERTLGVHPETGRAILVRTGRYGPYVAEEAPEGSDEKPRTASLFATMDPETVTLGEAVRLLSLPRNVGAAPDGEEIVAANGRYGPFIKKASETRSLESEEQLFTITVEEALALLAEPKRSRRQAAAAPLRELGADPASGRPLVVKEGRFGPYVTDGETNASLRGGDTPESLTLERAVELLADRRSRGPTRKTRRKTRS